jgi:hypothetical protein
MIRHKIGRVVTERIRVAEVDARGDFSEGSGAQEKETGPGSPEGLHSRRAGKIVEAEIVEAEIVDVTVEQD